MSVSSAKRSIKFLRANPSRRIKRHLEKSKRALNIFVHVIRPNEILILEILREYFFLFLLRHAQRLPPVLRLHPNKRSVCLCNNGRWLAAEHVRENHSDSFFLYCRRRSRRLPRESMGPNGAIGVAHYKIIGPLSFYYS